MTGWLKVIERGTHPPLDILWDDDDDDDDDDACPTQKLPTDATQTPDRGARTSKHRTSHKKPCHWYPSTSWRRQVRKGRQKRLWDSFYEKCASSAVTEHGLCESDSDGSVDIYQCDQPEVRPAAVAKCQSKQAFKVSRGRHGRHTPKDGPLNQITYEVELRPQIPYIAKRKSETVCLEMPNSLLTSACDRPLFTNLIIPAFFSIVNRWYCFPHFDAIGEYDEGGVKAIAGKRNPQDVDKGVC
ncbi:hypothetical protein HPB51_000541 [Rhipicephalus microplus]|uniref:Uncharacterized protein n=1 Tax=Rhipicephalus microplus TaxID=6941 RepID=A0A9J6EQI5_RHIMP|nr:hypothetical protein HPB51_000541 [Rhipicephalus microplus]